MLGQSGTRDVVDAHVAFLAQERGWPVLSSDPDGIRAIDPSLEVEPI